MKVNPRKMNRQTAQRVRGIINELKAGPPDQIDDLPQKVAAVLMYSWGTGGLALLKTRQRQLDKWLDGKELWREQYLDSLLYSKDFQALERQTRRALSEGQPSGNDRLYRLKAFLSMGRIGDAEAFAKEILSGDDLENTSFEERDNGVQVLIALGQRPWLEEHAPKAMAACSMANYLEVIDRDPDQEPLKCLYVNLDRDLERRARAEAFLGSGASVERVPGIPGKALPQTFVESSGWPIKVRSRGELGAFLSHLQAWERVAGGPGDDFTLIAEDDSIFGLGPARGFDRVRAMASDGGYGLVTVNAAPAYNVTRWYGSAPRIIPAQEAMDRTLGKAAGLGAYGYLLNASGAERLLRVTQQIGIAAVVDWFILIAFLDDPLALGDHFRYGGGISAAHGLAKEGQWEAPTHKAGCYSLPLVRHVDFGQKSINEESF